MQKYAFSSNFQSQSFKERFFYNLSGLSLEFCAHIAADYRVPVGNLGRTDAQALVADGDGVGVVVACFQFAVGNGERGVVVIAVEHHCQADACLGLREEDDRRGERAAYRHIKAGCLCLLIRLGYAGSGVEAARQHQFGERVAFRLNGGEVHAAASLEGEGNLAHAVVERTVLAACLGAVDEVHRRIVRIGSGTGGIEEIYLRLVLLRRGIGGGGQCAAIAVVGIVEVVEASSSKKMMLPAGSNFPFALR